MNLPQECYKEALGTAKHWTTYSSKTFIPHEQFNTILFNLLQNPPTNLPNLNVYGKAVSIVKRLLEKSKYVKLLENTSSLE